MESLQPLHLEFAIAAIQAEEVPFLDLHWLIAQADLKTAKVAGEEAATEFLAEACHLSMNPMYLA